MQINNSQQQLRVQYSQIMQQGRLESTQGRAPQASPNSAMVTAESTVSIANQTQTVINQTSVAPSTRTPASMNNNIAAAMPWLTTEISPNAKTTSAQASQVSATLGALAALEARPTMAPEVAASSTTNTANDTASAEVDESQDEQPFNAMHSFQEVRQILATLQQSWAQRLPARTDDDIATAIKSPQQAELDTKTSRQTLLPTQAPLMPPNVTNAPSTSIAQWSYRYQSLEVDFAGAVNLADGSSVSWQFNLQVTESRFDLRQAPPPELKDPLVISLGGGIAAIGQERVAFDLIAGDAMEQLPKLSGQDYYLAWDRNNNQRIDDGQELFGPSTGQGFAELATFDADHNGFIDSADPVYDKISLWQPGQSLQSLKGMGIAAISTQAAATPFNYYHEDQLLARLSKSSIYLSQAQQQGVTDTIGAKQPLGYTVGLVQQIDVSA